MYKLKVRLRGSRSIKVLERVTCYFAVYQAICRLLGQFAVFQAICQVLPYSASILPYSTSTVITVFQAICRFSRQFAVFQAVCQILPNSAKFCHMVKLTNYNFLSLGQKIAIGSLNTSALAASSISLHILALVAPFLIFLKLSIFQRQFQRQILEQ